MITRSYIDGSSLDRINRFVWGILRVTGSQLCVGVLHDQLAEEVRKALHPLYSSTRGTERVIRFVYSKGLFKRVIAVEYREGVVEFNGFCDTYTWLCDWRICLKTRLVTGG